MYTCFRCFVFANDLYAPNKTDRDFYDLYAPNRTDRDFSSREQNWSWFYSNGRDSHMVVVILLQSYRQSRGRV